MTGISLIRRTAIIVLLLCLAASLAANPYHPNILKSQVVTLDATAIERWANSGTPFALTFGNTTLSVVLTPAPVFPEEGVTIVEVAKDDSTKETVVHGNFTYAGEILGEDPATTEVRLTIAEGVLEGYVLSSADWWFIEPLVRFDPKAGSDQYLVYTARETGFAVEFPGDTENGDVLFDHPFVKDGKFPLCTVADFEYIEQSGSFARVLARHAALINDVNGIYKMQFGRELRVPRVLADTTDTRLTSSDPARLLEQLGPFANLGRLFQDGCFVAHLTTGKDLNGDALERARLQGFRSLSQQSRTLAFRNTILAAHAIAHNFNSVHEEAEEYLIESSNLVWRKTLDAEKFDSIATIGRFSDGRLGPAFNNVERICAHLAGRGFPCQ
jgi:hypothetical protein